MHRVIDAAVDLTDFAPALAARGVETVIRYYNHRNSAALPTKRVEPREAVALAEAGLSLAVVFQQRGGAGGSIEDLDRESGLRDATRALALAALLRQPRRSAIYFAVDHDYFRRSEIARIEPYFDAVRSVLGSRYRVGVYGSGAIGRHMVERGVADLVWLAAARGWAGTRSMLASGAWTLFQKDLDLVYPGGDFRYDGNVVNPATPDFGQFVPNAGKTAMVRAETAGARAATTLMEVTARSGLNLRRGPGLDFDRIRVLPAGALVTALGTRDAWMQLDLEGDGLADGYAHGGFLRALSDQRPNAQDVPGGPYAVARAELARDVREVPGPGSNPRIVLYHASTAGGAASDGVPWCSSFANFCVTEAGLEGTDSKWAMSWHDKGWGEDVTGAPREGDLAVFRRRAGGPTGTVQGGHVGFYVGEACDRLAILGGNQSNRVRISRYPSGGMLGGHHYELLSIRRP